jgi:hypothetical protein
MGGIRSWSAGVAVLAVTAGVLTTPAAEVQYQLAASAGVTVLQPPTALTVGQDQHSAFPGLAQRPDGSLHLVWRQGTDHAPARDGRIMSAVSRDGGATYQETQTLRVGGDHRDPSISYVDGMGHLTWFAGSTASPALGAFTMREWGPTVRFDGGLAYAATTAPIVKLPDGRLGGAFYGRQPGENVDTTFMAWSTNQGRTWTTNRITNMVGAGVHTNEPWLVVSEGITHWFYRWGTYDGIGHRSSTNSGTSGWSPQRKILNNATGRPTVVAADDGTLVMVYREKPTGHARIAYSRDQAQTWTDGGVLMASLGDIGMSYAAMVSVGGEIVGVLGMEEPTKRSKLYEFKLDT